MKRSVRAFLWGFLGVLLAAMLSLGAFALAGRSIGEPAQAPRVPAVERSESPSRTPSASPSDRDERTPSETPSDTPSPSDDDDHGGDGDDHGGNSGPGGGDDHPDDD